MDLKKHLQETLTFNKFETLHDIIGISKTRCTQMLNNPQTMTFAEINKLCEVFKLEPGTLVKVYNCGTEILTYAELKELNAL